MSFAGSTASVCPCMRCSGRFGSARIEFGFGAADFGAVDPASSSTGTSANGWPAAKDGKAIGIATYAVPLRNGTKTVQLAPAASAPLLLMLLWWDQNIEPITTLGGYNYRDIRGSTKTLSNHASGTAVDVNASKHPLGQHGTVSAADALRIAAKATSLGLTWGGTWLTRPDEMHVEMARGGKVGAVAAVASSSVLPLVFLAGSLWLARRQGWV